jgi:hypothetical protein
VQSSWRLNSCPLAEIVEGEMVGGLRRKMYKAYIKVCSIEEGGVEFEL